MRLGAGADAGLQGGASSVVRSCSAVLGPRLRLRPQIPLRPFVGFGGLGLMLRFRDSRFLGSRAALVRFSGHVGNGTVEVRGCARYGADDFVD